MKRNGRCNGVAGGRVYVLGTNSDGRSIESRCVPRGSVHTEDFNISAVDAFDERGLAVDLNGRAVGRFCGIRTFRPPDRQVIAFGQE